MHTRYVFALTVGLLCSTIADAPACALHQPSAAPFDFSKNAPPLWIGPAMSGSWYSPDRSGEGFIVQVLSDGSVLAIWFTYPPAGSAGKQAWIMAQGGAIDGDTVRFSTVFTTSGPKFGSAFDPAALVIEPWGTLEMTFSSCNVAQVRYAGPAAWGSGTRDVQRLSTLDELGCGGKQRLTATGSRALNGLRQRSAARYDPTHSGEGWFVEELADGRATVYWFTYDEQGRQAWTIGSAASSGELLDVTENLQTSGTNFGAAFNPNNVQLIPWGRLSMRLDRCDAGQIDYASTLPGVGSGTLRPQRLTQLAGAACVEGTPRAPTNGSWSAGAAMPTPQSELAVATVDGKFYVAGGFGDPRGFKRYDPQNDSWTVLANLPGARDHALAVASNGTIFVAGGNFTNSTGDQLSPGWRYDVSENRWESVSTLPAFVASGAATLNGFAYFGNERGELAQFDPRTNRMRVFEADARGSLRDHSQTIAFMGEIWMIAGRGGAGGETSIVSIFDPASETWRNGPRLVNVRAGFAAAAAATQLIVAGGEIIYTGTSLVGTMEGLAAGDDSWTALPSLPVPIHGVGGAVLDNAFYALGGSTRAGGVRNAGQVQIYRWTP